MSQESKPKKKRFELPEARIRPDVEAHVRRMMRQMRAGDLHPIEDAPEESTPVPQTMVPQTTVVSQGKPPWSETTVVPETRVVPQTTLKGVTRIPNIILDGLCSQLDVFEQAVYLRLFRLSHGFQKETCTVGYDRLAMAVNISEKSVRRAIISLERRGLIKRMGASFGGKSKGNLYQVGVPTTPVPQTTLVGQTTVVPQTSNKEKLLKENSLKARYAEIAQKQSKGNVGRSWFPSERAEDFERLVRQAGLEYDPVLADLALNGEVN